MPKDSDYSPVLVATVVCGSVVDAIVGTFCRVLDTDAVFAVLVTDARWVAGVLSCGVVEPLVSAFADALGECTLALPVGDVVDPECVVVSEWLVALGWPVVVATPAASGPDAVFVDAPDAVVVGAEDGSAPDAEWSWRAVPDGGVELVALTAPGALDEDPLPPAVDPAPAPPELVSPWVADVEDAPPSECSVSAWASPALASTAAPRPMVIAPVRNQVDTGSTRPASRSAVRLSCRPLLRCFPAM